MAITEAEALYITRIAGEAAKGIVGPEAHGAHGQLADTIASALERIAENAHARGVAASMVQMSLVPDGAIAVG